jgi:hypothetical protein
MAGKGSDVVVAMAEVLGHDMAEFGWGSVFFFKNLQVPVLRVLSKYRLDVHGSGMGRSQTCTTQSYHRWGWGSSVDN